MGGAGNLLEEVTEDGGALGLLLLLLLLLGFFLGLLLSLLGGLSRGGSGNYKKCQREKKIKMWL